MQLASCSVAQEHLAAETNPEKRHVLWAPKMQQVIHDLEFHASDTNIVDNPKTAQEPNSGRLEDGDPNEDPKNQTESKLSSVWKNLYGHLWIISSHRALRRTEQQEANIRQD
ncbi:hypothetical protein V3481_006461 [Fusarium oxysporum f. sp. vasinfectum]